MLNYTTTTIVNNGANVYADASKKLFRVNFGPELFNDGTIHKAVLVKKQAAVDAVKAKAEIVLPTTTGVVNRITLYIRLRNNNNEFFSNDWVFKGKPLYIEFNGGDDVEDVIAIAKKFMLAEYGANLVNFSVKEASDGSATYTATEDTALNASKTYYTKVGDVYTAVDTPDVSDIGTYFEMTTPAGAPSDKALVIEAVNQWEIFMTQDGSAENAVKVEVLDTTGTVEKFVVDTTATVTVDNGNEAFGDFAHIVKDLRLPTAANRRWQGIAEGDVFEGEPNDDKPLPTGKYTQYTIQYTSERGVGQQTVLGGVGVSRTVHVFYVEAGAVSDFEAALTTSSIGTSEGDACLI